jgi:hypothetical protein
MAKCIKCRARDAEVPDRDSMSMRIRVCWQCHSGALVGDMINVLEKRERNLKKYKALTLEVDDAKRT